MKLLKMLVLGGIVAASSSCCGTSEKPEGNFRYLIDEFADLKVMRYQIPGWDELSLQQKEYIYHLGEAAKYGRDIIWAQNCEVNLPVRKAVEDIIANYKGDRDCKDFQDFIVYAKRLFFSNGIHHLTDCWHLSDTAMSVTNFWMPYMILNLCFTGNPRTRHRI